MSEGPVFRGLYIGGRWTEPEGRSRFSTINPTDGSPVGEFVSGKAEDVEAAVASARSAAEAWKETPAPKRGEILLSAASVLKRRKEEVARTVTREMGKVIAEGRGDVQESIDFIEFMAGEG
ncbi:MAG TPA: aldehyde dehydrogenase family protein, partial [Thermoplasmata archaeon]|nr:aldehyde dehydrogenase family protein [Thermoplasmata archaeon]